MSVSAVDRRSFPHLSVFWRAKIQEMELSKFCWMSLLHSTIISRTM